MEPRASPTISARWAADPLDFDAYVAANGGRLLRTATLLVGPSDASDVVQDALIGLYRRWNRVVKTDKPDAYVHRTLVNAALQFRRRRRHVEMATTSLQPGHAEQVGDRQDMLQAVGRLPRRQRAVVVLAFYEDRSDAQIADLMGCSVGTVKSQKSRALDSLRRFMDPQPRLETT